MRKAIVLTVLTISLAVVGGAALSPSVDAQDKKAKAKKDTIGTVEIYKAKDGYRFRIKSADGKVIAMPPRARETKEEVASDLDEIKATLNKTKPSEIKD